MALSSSWNNNGLGRATRQRHLTLRIFFLLLVSLFSIWFAHGHNDARAKSIGMIFNNILNRYDFFPVYHVDTDLRYFTSHKNTYFSQRYFIESTTKLEFILVSNKRNVNWFWGIDLQSGMGKTAGNVFFDPMDINYGISPTLEIKRQSCFLQGGLEHCCFHEIDRKDFETVYWNKIFLAIGSRHYRLFEYWQELSAADTLRFVNRFSWYAKTGYYVKSAFGWITPTNLNGENRKENEIDLESRYAFYRRRSWIFALHCRAIYGTFLNYKNDRDIYWRWDFGLDLNSRRGRRGALIFMDYSLDHLPRYQNLPRFSKDKLIQIGVRLFD